LLFALGWHGIDNTCSKGTISHIDLTNWPNKITKLGHSLYVQAISVLGGITYLLYNGQLRGPFNGSWNEIFKKHPIPFYYCVGILKPFDLLSNCHSVVKTLLIVHSMCNVMAIWILHIFALQCMEERSSCFDYILKWVAHMRQNCC
jgi:hypothetical protein